MRRRRVVAALLRLKQQSNERMAVLIALALIMQPHGSAMVSAPNEISGASHPSRVPCAIRR